jgi:hypothetical protein
VHVDTPSFTGAEDRWAKVLSVSSSGAVRAVSSGRAGWVSG